MLKLKDYGGLLKLDWMHFCVMIPQVYENQGVECGGMAPIGSCVNTPVGEPLGRGGVACWVKYAFEGRALRFQSIQKISKSSIH